MGRFWTGCGALAVLVLAGCSGGGGGGASAGFDPSDIGDLVLTENTASRVAGQVAVAGSGGLSFSATLDPAQGVLLKTDLLPGTPELDAPTAGSATMRGGFALARARNAAETGGTWDADLDSVTGDLTLTARFGAGTLTGGGDGLTVNGRIAGDRLRGSVSYGGVAGDLDGIIGRRSAIGLFTATGSGEGYAGGFAVAR